jgi:hypothetical protein
MKWAKANIRIDYFVVGWESCAGRVLAICLRSAEMFRRLIAAVGVIAFALAYLPGASAFSALPSCCTGLICPMQLHHHAATHKDCGMAGMAENPANQQSMSRCPMNDVRHTAALVFVIGAPRVVESARILASPKSFSLPFAPDVVLDKTSPPPKPPAI